MIYQILPLTAAFSFLNIFTIIFLFFVVTFSRLLLSDKLDGVQQIQKIRESSKPRSASVSKTLQNLPKYLTLQ